MNKGIRNTSIVASFCLLWTGMALAQNPAADKDVFKGKLFPPNVILQHQEALALTEQQQAGIRQAVIELQSNIATFQWDLRDAYQKVLAELDRSPVDEKAVLGNVQAALNAENEVKKLQVTMLIRLRNLLTEEQLAYLKAQHDAD